MPPRALSPTGLVLVDKPAGPSSFAVVSGSRPHGRTGRSCGTLDPFATGLLLVLVGSATRLAQYLVGLDKRYVTRSTCVRGPHGGRRGRRASTSVTRPSSRSSSEGSGRSAARSCCACPAASAVKIEGERAYSASARARTSRCRTARRRSHELEMHRLRGRRGGARAARLLGDVHPRGRRRARRTLPSRFGAPPSGRSPSTMPTRSGS